MELTGLRDTNGFPRQHIAQQFETQYVQRHALTPLLVAQACQKYPPDDLIDWILSYVHRLIVGELQNKPNPALFLFLDKLIQARAWLLSSANINTQLLWEELFIEWAQIFQSQR